MFRDIQLKHTCGTSSLLWRQQDANVHINTHHCQVQLQVQHLKHWTREGSASQLGVQLLFEVMSGQRYQLFNVTRSVYRRINVRGSDPTCSFNLLQWVRGWLGLEQIMNRAYGQTELERIKWAATLKGTFIFVISVIIH